MWILWSEVTGMSILDGRYPLITGETVQLEGVHGYRKGVYNSKDQYRRDNWT
jgi:hypothetical protein